MNWTRWMTVTAIALILSPAASLAAEPDGAGEITLPLADYQALQERLRAWEHAAAEVPVGVTLSRAEVSVQAEGDLAAVEARVTVHVLSEGWVQVPLLPVGTAVDEAIVDGAAVALSPIGGDLVWSVKAPGVKRLVLRYKVRRHGGADAGELELPVPPAAALTLTATLPGRGHALTLVPAVGFEAREAGETTLVEATLPRTRALRLAWRLPEGRRHLVTGATYAGEAGEATVRWRATLDVEALSAEPLSIPVIRATAAVARATLDGAPARIEERDGFLAVRVHARGAHRVELDFETPVLRDDGPTATALWTPRPPLSRFTLSLPGAKLVTVDPAGGVTYAEGPEGRTVAAVNLPPTEEVTFRWSDALPQTSDEAVRANAELHHVVRAEEGVLQVTAYLSLDVTRGATSQVALDLPEGAAVNAVRGEGVTDWRVVEPGDDETAAPRAIVIYLDRDISGAHRLEVDYERLVDAAGEDTPETLDVPLVGARGAHRQRGMVALVHGTELQMKPTAAKAMSPVGENQLPAWLGERLSRSVTHTYKYVEPGAELTVKLAPFERKRARFDGVVDTLLSLADGVLKASASVRLTVKSGALDTLDLALPEGINVLSAAAPSLREHRVVEASAEGEPRRLRLSFTREIEGALTLEVAYERLLAPNDAAIPAPLLHVAGASLEHGRVGIEALSAVEVRAERVERLVPMDVQELPRQLVLRTTNPILLAYKYVHADPPASLTLSVERHAEVRVQVAAIDRAHYQSLWTDDGVVLTRARYEVRNRGKQFLSLALPGDAEIWSAELAGQPVKPARTGAEGTVLVPLLNATEPFAVELVYLVRREALGFTGEIEAALPVPDIVETRTSWEVFLPDDVEWGAVTSNMAVGQRPDAAVVDPGAEDGSGLAFGANAAQQLEGGRAGALPLRIDVPRRGRLLRLDKLLANQGGERARFSVSYRRRGADATGALLVFFGALLLGLMLLRRLEGLAPVPTGPALVVSALSLTAAAVGALVLGASLGWAVAAAGVVLLVAGWRWLVRRQPRADATAALET